MDIRWIDAWSSGLYLYCICVSYMCVVYVCCVYVLCMRGMDIYIRGMDIRRLFIDSWKLG